MAPTTRSALKKELPTEQLPSTSGRKRKTSVVNAKSKRSLVTRDLTNTTVERETTKHAASSHSRSASNIRSHQREQLENSVPNLPQSSTNSQKKRSRTRTVLESASPVTETGNVKHCTVEVAPSSRGRSKSKTARRSQNVVNNRTLARSNSERLQSSAKNAHADENRDAELPVVSAGSSANISVASKRDVGGTNLNATVKTSRVTEDVPEKLSQNEPELPPHPRSLPSYDIDARETQSDPESSALDSFRECVAKRLESTLMHKYSFQRRFVNTSNNPAEHVVPSTSGSDFMHYIHQRTIGQKSSIVRALEPVCSPVVNHFSHLTVYKTLSPFNRRATSMAWHPTHPSTLAVGSKGGDIILWNFESSKDDLFIPGIGQGGQILAMKFNLENPMLLYTAAVDGKVCLQDFYGKHNQVLLDTMNWDQWFSALDVSFRGKMLAAGDSLGNVTLMTTEGEKAWSKRLHRTKVSHAEFSPRENWLLVTTSIDNTMKIWDIRSVKTRDSALHVCAHDKAVNSAYFSLQNGTRILTTDQHSEIRVYKSPLWELERSIPHPHRQFQHLTPIKAYWHPLVDVVMVGRYPDENFPGYAPGERRSVDFFSVETGKMIYQLTEQGVVGILSLNQFNNTGEVLASCMGYNLLVWKHKEEVEAHRRALHQLAAKNISSKGNKYLHRAHPKPRNRALSQDESKFNALIRSKICP